MESEHASENELITVSAANSAHSVKLEMGERTESKVSCSSIYPHVPSTSYGADWGLLASHTSSGVSGENSLGEQLGSERIPFSSLESCRESSSALPARSPSLEEMPSVSGTNSQMSVSFASSQMSVPLTSSRTSVPISSQMSVPLTSSWTLVPISSQMSVPLTSSQPSVPFTNTQVSVSCTSVPCTPVPCTNFQAVSSQTLVHDTNSQLSVPSHPSVPFTSFQMSIPVSHSQPSPVGGELSPVRSSHFSNSSSNSEHSSRTWYKQPSTVSSPCSHPPGSSTLPACEQSSTASLLQAEGRDTNSSPQEGVVACAAPRTDAAEARGDEQSCVGRASAYQGLVGVDSEEKMPPGMAPVVKRSGRLTRQSARAGAERVERTTRRLRARQSPKSQAEAEKGTRSSPAVEKPVTQPGLSPSPAPPSQEPEMPSPLAQELKPRRLNRKPRHTQRMWRPDIRGEPFDRWRVIGQSQGLTSDTEIAVFLMQYYDNAMSKQSAEICAICRAILTLTCPACQPSLQMTGSHGHSLPTPDASSAKVGNMIVEAKTEPIDTPPDESLEQLPWQLAPEPQLLQEPEPEVEPGFLECDDEFGEEEEKAKPRRRRRGRPARSNKRSAEKEPSFPKIKLKKTRKYKCTHEGCEAAFAKSSRLKIHARIHTGEKPFLCKDCGKAFTQKSGLTVHSQKHTGLRPFACEECGASFPNSSTLKQHMRRHTGEKPFACKKCDKTFRWSGHLTQHMRMHDGIKPFLCPDCGKSFSASSDLVKHRVTHTKSRPYKCDKCDKAYAFQHRLTAHQRSHTGDRPFLCSECGAAFSRAHNLTVHMRTHTGDKPYWCKDCGAKFSDSGNFCKHKKTKHRENAQNANAAKTDGVASTGAMVTSLPDSNLTADLDIARLTDCERLLDIDRAEGSPGSADVVESKLPNITKMANDVREPSLADKVKLPSMARVVRRAKRERNRRESSNVTLTSMSLMLTPTSMTSTPALMTSSVSLPSNLPADFKSLLPPLGSGNQLTTTTTTMTNFPSHLSSTLSIGSPPSLPVQTQLSVSPTVSPVVSLPPQCSPGPAVSNESTLSALSPAAQLSEYQAAQAEEVVFPPQYYDSYAYYCQEQQ